MERINNYDNLKKYALSLFLNQKNKGFNLLDTDEKLLNEVKYFVENNMASMDERIEDKYISLYDVVTLFKSTADELEISTDLIHTKIADLLNENLLEEDDYFNTTSKFDSENKKLILIIKDHFNRDYEKIEFIREGADLKIVSGTFKYNQYKLNTVCELLEKLYNEYMKYYNFMKQTSYNISTPYSDFYIDIDFLRISIFSTIEYDDMTFIGSPYSRYIRSKIRNFTISALISPWERFLLSCDYESHSKSVKISNTVAGKEEKIFKNIFIDIDDCPEWCQEQLRGIRKKQLGKLKLEKTANKCLGESPECFISKQDIYTVPNSKQTEPVPQKSLVRKLKDGFNKDTK